MTKQRWQRRKDARAPEILEAALACFAEKGFAGTRMDDIAARAGISKGTIYLYFENKEAVFKALANQSVGQKIAAVTAQAAAYDGPTRDLLRMIIMAGGEFATTSDRIVLPRLVLAEAGNFPELAQFWRREVIDRVIAVLESVIRRGIARGELRDLPSHHAARLCMAPVVLMLLWGSLFARFDAEPYDYAGLVETHLDVLLAGLEVRS